MYKEKIQKLAEAISMVPDTNMRESEFKFLARSCTSFPTYVNDVVAMTLEITVARFKYSDDIQSLQDVIQRADRNRRDSHLFLVDSINALNRLCKFHNLEPFSTVNINGVEYGRDVELDSERDCRAAAANIAKEFVDEMYFEGRNRNKGLDVAYEMEKDQARINPEMVMSKILDDEQIL